MTKLSRGGRTLRLTCYSNAFLIWIFLFIKQNFRAAQIILILFKIVFNSKIYNYFIRSKKKLIILFTLTHQENNDKRKINIEQRGWGIVTVGRWSHIYEQTAAAFDSHWIYLRIKRYNFINPNYNSVSLIINRSFIIFTNEFHISIYYVIHHEYQFFKK